jgi:hypothetical protein
MGERHGYHPIEARQAHMADLVNHIMGNHTNLRFRIGWTLTPYTHTKINNVAYKAFFPESITAVRNAASLALAAETKAELITQAKRYTAAKPPDDPVELEFTTRTIERIEELIKRAGPSYIPPSSDLKKDFGMQFARFELLYDTEGRKRTATKGYDRELAPRLTFVEGLTGIVMREVEELIAQNPPPEQLIRRSTASRRFSELDHLLDPSAIL